MAPRESPRPRPRERTHRHGKRGSYGQSPRKHRSKAVSSESSSQALSADALAKLDRLNQYPARSEEITPKKTRRKRHRDIVEEKVEIEQPRRQHKRKKRRVVSGALLEEGDGKKLRGLRGGATYDGYEKADYEFDTGKRKKRLCMFPFGFWLTHQYAHADV